MNIEQEEEIIYNPYNENNKEITFSEIQKILNTYNVYYDIKNIELFLRSMVHQSYTIPQQLNENVILAIKPPNCLDLKKNRGNVLNF